MGNKMTKCGCCKESATDEKTLEETEVEYTPSNGTPSGSKKPIGNKEFENSEIDAVVTSNLSQFDTLNGSLISELDPKYFYKMDHKKRGMALIFNHEMFDCNSPRKGTSADRDRLEYTLESLGFEVKIFENETISEIKGVLEEISEMDHSDSDCLMIVILSHGDVVPLVDRRGKEFTTILTHDLVSYLHATDNKYPLQMIWENFTNEKCPSLIDKPRIFLIQACQGDNSDEGYKVPMETYRRLRSPSSDIIPFKSTKYKPFEAVKIDTKKNLPQKDFLIVYSTMPGYFSYRDTINGTWFIEAFCEVLNEKKYEIDFFQLLTFVNQKVAIDYQSEDVALKQMPCIVSMLTKLLVFSEKKSIANVN